MKKLIFGAIVAAIALGANAAAMDWKVTIDDADRQKQFMFFNASDRTAVLTLLDAGGENIYSDVAAYAYGGGTGGTSKQFATSSKSSSKTGGLTTIDKGDNVFLVLFDTTDTAKIGDGLAYKTTDDINTSGWIYDGTAYPPEPSPGNMPITASFTGSGTVGGDVPEPTSAMLILFGMAGLALRRRCA